MMALCSSAQARPTVKKRSRTMRVALLTPEQSHIGAGIVRGNLAGSHALFEPCAQVEPHRRKARERRTEHRQSFQEVHHAKAAEDRGPRQRPDHRLHAYQAETLRLDLAPQPFGGPSPVVAGMRMIEPGAV